MSKSSHRQQFKNPPTNRNYDKCIITKKQRKYVIVWEILLLVNIPNVYYTLNIFTLLNVQGIFPLDRNMFGKTLGLARNVVRKFIHSVTLHWLTLPQLQTDHIPTKYFTLPSQILHRRACSTSVTFNVSTVQKNAKEPSQLEARQILSRG